MAQFALEEAVTGGIGGALLESFKDIGKAGRIGKFLGRTAKVAEESEEAVKALSVAERSVRQAASRDIAVLGQKSINSTLKEWGSKALDMVPGVGTARELNTAWKEGNNIAQVTGMGLGAVKRTLGELNMANTEAIMEGSSTYVQTRDSMIDQYTKDHGEAPNADVLNNIEKLAYQAGTENTKFNNAILLASNRLAFDGLFKSIKANSFLGRVLPETESAVTKVSGKLEGKAVDESIKGKAATLLFKKGETFKTLRNIYKEFGPKKAAIEGSKLLASHLGHIEVSEGIQELTQNASNDYFTSLAYAKYNNSKPLTFEDSFYKQLKNEDGSWNLDGIKTFLMGAATGLVVNGPMHLIKTGFDKSRSNYVNRNLSEEQKAKKDGLGTALENLNTQVKGIIADPKSILSPVIESLTTQEALSKELQKAAASGSTFDYKNLQNTVLNQLLGKAGLVSSPEVVLNYLNNLQDSMSQDEFEKAFSPEWTEGSKPSKEQFFNTLKQSTEGYLEARQLLEDKIPDYYPEKFEKDSPEYTNALMLRRTRQEVIHTLASQRSAMLDAHTRQGEVLNALSNTKDIGGSLSQTAQILMSEKKTHSEIANIRTQIQTLTGGQLDQKGRDRLNLLNKQLTALQTWEETDKSETTKAGTQRKTYGMKAYKAFANFLTLKNQENNIEVPVTTHQITSHFENIKDYIELNRRKEDLLDAYDWLAQPKHHQTFLNKVAHGLRSANLQLILDHLSMSPGFVFKNKGLIDEATKLTALENPTDEQIERMYTIGQDIADKAAQYPPEEEDAFNKKFDAIASDPAFVDEHKEFFDKLDELNKRISESQDEDEKNDLKLQVTEVLQQIRQEILKEIENTEEEKPQQEEVKKAEETESEFKKDFEKTKADIQKITKVEDLYKYQKENGKILPLAEEAQLAQLFEERKAQILKNFPLENTKFGTVVQNQFDGRIAVIGKVNDKGTKNESVILFSPTGTVNSGTPVLTSDLVKDWVPIHDDYKTYKPKEKAPAPAVSGTDTKAILAQVSENLQRVLEQQPSTETDAPYGMYDFKDPVGTLPLYVYGYIKSHPEMKWEDIMHMVLAPVDSTDTAAQKKEGMLYSALIPSIIFKMMSSPELLSPEMADTLDNLDVNKVKQLASEWNPLKGLDVINNVLNPDKSIDVFNLWKSLFGNLYKQNLEITEGDEQLDPEKPNYYLRTTGSETKGPESNTLSNDAATVRWYNTLRIIGALQESQNVPLPDLKFRTVDGREITGVRLAAVSALTINRDYPEHLNHAAQDYLDRTKKSAGSPEALNKAFNKGLYVTFIDSAGKILKFNQEGLVDDGGQYNFGSLPSVKQEHGIWTVSSASGYRLPKEAEAAQQEKIQKLAKLRAYLESKEDIVPILFDGVHEGGFTYSTDLDPVSSKDTVVLMPNNKGSVSFYKQESDGTYNPLKTPTLGSNKDLLDSIFHYLTHPEELKNKDDGSGHYTALQYASQFLNLSNGIPKGGKLAEKIIAPKSQYRLGIEKSNNNLRLKVFNDEGQEKIYEDLSNLSDSEAQEVKKILGDQKLFFSTEQGEAGVKLKDSVTVYRPTAGEGYVKEEVPYMQFLSEAGVGVPQRTVDRKFNPSAVFDIDKVPEIKSTSKPTTEKKTNYTQQELPEYESGATLSDFPTLAEMEKINMELNEDSFGVDSGVDPDDFGLGAQTYDSGATADDFGLAPAPVIEKKVTTPKFERKENPTIDEILAGGYSDADLAQEEAEGTISKEQRTEIEAEEAKLFSFDQDDSFPDGESENEDFEDPCKE